MRVIIRRCDDGADLGMAKRSTWDVVAIDRGGERTIANVDTRAQAKRWRDDVRATLAVASWIAPD